MPSNVIHLVSCVTRILDSLSQKGNTSFVIEPALKCMHCATWANRLYCADALSTDNVFPGSWQWQLELPSGQWPIQWEVGEIQVLQCVLNPRKWLLEVDAITKLVRPGSASTPLSDREVKNRKFEITNPYGEYPYRPYDGSEFEYDVSLVSTIRYILILLWYWWALQLKTMFDLAPSSQIYQLAYVDDNGVHIPGTETGAPFRTVDEWVDLTRM